MEPTVVVIGLGYVGLPLAVALARRFDTWGLDVDAARIAGLERGGRGLAPAERDAVVAVASRAADVDLSDDEMLDELPPDAVRRLIRAGGGRGPRAQSL